MSDTAYPEIPRVDALEKVRGLTRYGADHTPRNVLHADLSVSTIVRGRIETLDISAAEAVEGVRYVLTHENAGEIASTGFLLGGGFGFQSFQPMGSDQIAYRGQPIALVVAETLEAAIEAAALVRATYREERFSSEIDSEGSETIEQASAPLGHPSPDVVFGDAQTAFEEAEFKVEAEYHSPPQHQNPIELVSTLAEWDGDRLIIHEGTQNANAIRFGLATQLGISADHIEVRSPTVGGGFGQKNSLQEQTVLAALAAYATNRPVKLVVPRAQLFLGASFRPECRHRIRLGADRAGRLVAALHEVDGQTSRHDLFPGEYCQTSARLHGIPNFAGAHRMVRTDVQTPGYMRAPFEHTACFAMESAIDEMAYLLNRDPVELRLANDTDTDPVENLPLSSRHLAECLRRGAARFGWDRREMAPTSMRAQDGSFLGWGVACGAYPGNAAANVAHLTVRSNGTVEVSAGVHEMGQGIRTVLANVVARRLGVPTESITALLGDTRGAFPHLTAGSWGTSASVPAVMRACDALLEQLREIAPDSAGASPFEILSRAGRDELRVEVGYSAPGQDPASVERLASGFASPTGPDYDGFVTFSYIAHFVEVRVEANTRRIRIPRVVSVADCGRVLSPRTARSQLYGGVVWGIGATLREEAEVDSRYGGFLNADIAEYVIPVNADIGVIEAEFIDEPDPRINEAGVKGLGEVVMAGVAPAIANAVFHATGRRVRDLPIRVDDLL
jgi:xanthine dehydrogenase YagR molybdenum-binding subunit